MRLVQLLAPVAGLVAAVNAWDKPTSTVWTTEIVTKYTTYCPSPTTIAYKNVTYTVTEPTTLTITNCPCTISHHKPPPVTTTCPPPPPPPPCTNSTVIYPNTTALPPPGTTVITYPPTTELSGTTVISRPPPTPTTSPAHVTAAAATVGSGIGAIGLIAGFAALVL